jgi:hypothetical protein
VGVATGHWLLWAMPEMQILVAVVVAVVINFHRRHRRLWHCHPKIPCTSRNHSHAHLQRIGVLGCTYRGDCRGLPSELLVEAVRGNPMVAEVVQAGLEPLLEFLLSAGSTYTITVGGGGAGVRNYAETARQ